MTDKNMKIVFCVFSESVLYRIFSDRENADYYRRWLDKYWASDNNPQIAYIVEAELDDEYVMPGSLSRIE